MKKIGIIIVLFSLPVLLYPSLGFADTQTKKEMRNILESYLKLIPYMYEGSLKVSNKDVAKQLQEFEEAVK